MSDPSLDARSAPERWLTRAETVLYGGIAVLLAAMTLAIVISIILLRRFSADRTD